MATASRARARDKGGRFGSDAPDDKKAEPDPDPVESEKDDAEDKAPATIGKGRLTLTFHRAGDVSSDLARIKVLIFGQSGAGKTHFASGAPNALVALVESQGFETIKANHPNTIVPGRPDADGTPRLRTMDEVRELLLLAKRGVLREQGIDTIVLDSLTEIQQMMMEEILGGKGKNRSVFSKNDWGTLAQKMRAFMRLIRDLDYHVICVALCDWFFDEESQRRMVSPLLKGSISKELPGYFHLVGYAYKRQIENPEASDDRSVQHLILLDGDDRYLCKPFGSLTGVVEPSFPLWLDVITGRTETATLPDAPLPSEIMGSGEEVQTKGPRFGGDDDEDE